MLSLLSEFILREMARTRGPQTWAVLDWAAQQTKPFTISDMHGIYKKAGGGLTVQQFSTLINHYIAKDDREDKEKYKLSQSRPIKIVKKGARGKGHPALYLWGLSAPLRKPQDINQISTANKDGDDDSEDINDLINKISDAIGRDKFRYEVQSWKAIGNIKKVAAHIKASPNIPNKFKMQAIQIAFDILEPNDSSSKQSQKPPEKNAFGSNINKQDVDDSDDEEPAVNSAQDDYEPNADSEDDDEYDEDDGWQKVEPDEEENNDFSDDEKTNPDITPPNFDDEKSEVDDEYDEDDGWEKVEPDEEENNEYPDFLPEINEEGDKFEYGMWRLVSEGGLQPDDPFWDQIKNAKNDVEVYSIIRNNNSIPKTLFKASLDVAKYVFEKLGKDWEGKDISKNWRESKNLFSIFNIK